MIDTNASPTPLMISLDDDLAMHAVYDQIAHGLKADHINFDTIEDTLTYLNSSNATPQIIIVDRLLPDGDGLDFSVFVHKQLPRLKNASIFLISGVETEDTDLRLQEGNIKHRIIKPFKANDIFQLLENELLQENSAFNPTNDDFINFAFADDLLRLSIELLHASHVPNADPKRVLHSIHGIAGMLEQESLRSNAFRLMELEGNLHKVDYLPMILHIVHQCEEVAQGLIGDKMEPPTIIAL